ncbi:MAG: hypothetical protein ACK53A_07010 [Gemmatimonadota bacterium]
MLELVQGEEAGIAESCDRLLREGAKLLAKKLVARVTIRRVEHRPAEPLDLRPLEIGVFNGLGAESCRDRRAIPTPEDHDDDRRRPPTLANAVQIAEQAGRRQTGCGEGDDLKRSRPVAEEQVAGANVSGVRPREGSGVSVYQKH